jgi:8-amino-7-oxononanoate synthase
MSKLDFMKAELSLLEDAHLYRRTTAFDSPQSRWVTQKGKRLLMLSSNSYLDFCSDPTVKSFVQETAERYGTGTGGARLTTGTSDLTDQLEQAIANFKGTEAALVFNTGYMANVGVISAICSKDWVIFSDSLNHASIIDGCRLSKAKIVVYRHNDMDDLEEKLRQFAPEKGLVVSDGVFSMDGDIVNLPRLVALCDRYNVLSMIDEAHATGVVGETGRGTAEHFHMDHGADITVGTLSKAVGSEGGFVCGEQVLIEYLKNKARSFIFSTAMSPVTVAASLSAVTQMTESAERTVRLQENIAYFCEALKEQGIEAQSETAIIPIIIGDEAAAMDIASRLREQGYYVSAIRYPTVERGSARLRITLMATHTKEELAQAASAIGAAVRQVSL